MTDQRQPRGKFLTVRLTEEEHKAFGVKAKEYGGVTFVLREIVQAFIEKRLIVKPPVNPKESLYHVE
jgi:hypothetical protein